MKKQSLAALAILGATMGMGAVPQTLPTEQTQKTQRHNEGVEKTPVTVRQGRPTSINPTGSYTEFINPGRSPKEYGQWLQSTGRQKWNKGGKK